MNRTFAARYCRACGAHLPDGDSGPECASCAERTSDLLSRPPRVPPEFWVTDRMRDALATWHMGRVISAYRMHPLHGRVLSQELVGGWVGLTQAQLSRIENGPPIKDLDRLSLWARTLSIPAQLLWFKVRRAEAGDKPAGDRLRRGPPAVAPSAPALVSGDGVPGSRVLRMLPPVIADFTGRLEQCAALADVLSDVSGPRVVVVSGPAGSGKTSLAVQVAHRVAELFPDGQLFLRLRAADGAAVSPETVVTRILHLLGFRGAAVPQNLDDQCGLFRSAVAGQRILFVLDDVIDEDQARRLLPGTSSCAVLITSRRRLAGLEGARWHPLGSMSPEESRALLGRIAGEDRVAAEEDAAGQLVELCAGLPLALRVVAASLASRSDWTLEHAAALFGDRRRRLDLLTAGDLQVRASFLVSYEHLQPDSQRLFRLLGVLEAADFPGWVAAALTNQCSAAAEDALDRLIDAHLVETMSVEDHRRYRLHPLMQLLAAELTREQDSEQARQDALRRLAGGYMYAADIAATGLRQRFVLDAVPDECRHADEPTQISARAEARAWFDREHFALAALVSQTADGGLTDYSWRLLQRFVCYLDLCHDLASIETLAAETLPAVIAAGDLRGEAAVLRIQCDPMGYRDHYSAILPLARRALDLRIQLDDVAAEAEVRRVLGAALTYIVEPQTAGFSEARDHLEAALLLARKNGDHLGAHRTLRVLALLLANIDGESGDFSPSLDLLADAIAEGRLAGASVGVCLREAGILLSMSSRHDEAEAFLLEALQELSSEGDVWRVSSVDIAIASVHIDLGRLDEAEARLDRLGPVVASFQHAYEDGSLLAVRSRLARARGQLEEAEALAKRVAEKWKNLLDQPNTLIDRWWSRTT